MVRTLGAHAQAGGKILVVDDLAAGRTLDPQPLRHAALLVRRFDGLADLLEPGHWGQSSTGVVCGLRSSVWRSRGWSWFVFRLRVGEPDSRPKTHDHTRTRQRYVRGT